MDVGVCGYAGAGKDTVAQMIVEEFGYIRLAFADPLRDLLYRLDPYVPYYDTEGYGPYHAYVNRLGYEKAKRGNSHVRRLHQRLGEGARQLLGEDVWLRVAMDRADDLKHPVVFSDCRYDNEAAAIRERPGWIILVHRPGVGPANDHPSENLPKENGYDFVILNEGGLDDLREEVRNLPLPRMAVR